MLCEGCHGLWGTVAHRGGVALQLGSLRPGPASATRKLRGPGQVSMRVCLSLLVNDITGGKEALSWFDYKIPPQSQVSEHLFPSWRASSVSFRDPRRYAAMVGLWWLESAPLWVPSLLPGLGIQDTATDQPTPTATPSLLMDRTLWTELQEMSPTLSCFPRVSCHRVNPRSLGPEATWGSPATHTSCRYCSACSLASHDLPWEWYYGGRAALQQGHHSRVLFQVPRLEPDRG